MKKYLIVVFCFLCTLPGFTQFNDTTHYLVNFASTGVINKTNNSNSYVFSNAARFATRNKNTSLNSFSSWVYGWQGQRRTNNDFTSSLDFNLYKTPPRFYYWGLATYDKSLSLKINSRMQAGFGIAYSFIDNETAFINISDGILYEASNLAINDTTNEKHQVLRNSLRARYRFVINNIVVLDGTHFWQPSLNNLNDYILKSNVAVSIKLRTWLQVTAAAAHNKLSRTKRENLLITFGITAERYF